MKKLLLLGMLTMLLSIAAMAQNTTWWGYWNSSMPQTGINEVGDGQNSFFVRITANESMLAGSTIYGIRFYIGDKTAVKQAWIWVANSRQEETARKEIDIAELKDVSHDQQPTTAYFDEPLELLGTGRYASCYAGYTLVLEGSAQHPCQPMAAGAANRVSNYSCYKNNEPVENRYGPLAMQMLVGSEQFKGHAVKAGTLHEQIFYAGQTVTQQVTFTTDGTEAVESIDCRVTIDGTQQTEQHITLPQPTDELGVSIDLPVSISLPTSPQLYDYTIEVTRVNGQPNESSTATAGSRLYALSRQPLRRVVMEELTGTWCPNCPRGLVGIQLLEELFADRFIAIAVHGGDTSEPMRLDNYDGSTVVKGISSRMGGRPSCSVDRTYDCDPYGGVGPVTHFGADVVVGYRLNEPTVADLDVTASWTDASHSSLIIDAATTFRFSTTDSKQPYRLMLAVTADSLSGEGNDWLQVNTLVGRTDYDADLNEFIYGERYMRLKYNHVPLWADGVEQGIDGSIAPTLTADQPQHYRRTVALSDMPLGSLASTATPLHAVALLLDTTTGSVVNAAKAAVGDRASVDAPHSSVATHDATPSQRYTLDGRIATKNAVGRLMIERGSDGTIRKVIR